LKEKGPHGRENLLRRGDTQGFTYVRLQMREKRW